MPLFRSINLRVFLSQENKIFGQNTHCCRYFYEKAMREIDRSVFQEVLVADGVNQAKLAWPGKRKMCKKKK
jgi:hypothetical protein